MDDASPAVYKVITAMESPEWWSVYVPKIQQVTQARDFVEVAGMAIDLITVCLDVPYESVAVQVFDEGYAFWLDDDFDWKTP